MAIGDKAIKGSADGRHFFETLRPLRLACPGDARSGSDDVSNALYLCL